MIQIVILLLILMEEAVIAEETILYSNNVEIGAILGGIDIMKGYCKSISLYTALQCADAKPFIHVKNVPLERGINMSLPIRGPYGDLIYPDWDSLIKGKTSAVNTARQARVVNKDFWFGMPAGDNCGNWLTDCGQGSIKNADVLEQKIPINCLGKHTIVCVCLGGKTIIAATQTGSPTSTPTVQPSGIPTFLLVPSLSPSFIPSIQPSLSPSLIPSVQPTLSPSLTPTSSPTVQPTLPPTLIPTVQPTLPPTIIPTKQPTQTPTVPPTIQPTKQPTLQPTLTPTVQPTAASWNTRYQLVCAYGRTGGNNGLDGALAICNSLNIGQVAQHAGNPYPLLSNYNGNMNSIIQNAGFNVNVPVYNNGGQRIVSQLRNLLSGPWENALSAYSCNGFTDDRKNMVYWGMDQSGNAYSPHNCDWWRGEGAGQGWQGYTMYRDRANYQQSNNQWCTEPVGFLCLARIPFIYGSYRYCGANSCDFGSYS